MEKLAGKIAVVTEGNSGIGLATAKRFVEEGAYVFITGRRQADLDAAVNCSSTAVWRKFRQEGIRRRGDKETVGASEDWLSSKIVALLPNEWVKWG